jgi:hypothetical protein
MDDKQQRNTIIFNSSKSELFTPSNGLKSLNRKLRSQWKIMKYVKLFNVIMKRKFKKSWSTIPPISTK